MLTVHDDWTVPVGLIRSNLRRLKQIQWCRARVYLRRWCWSPETEDAVAGGSGIEDEGAPMVPVLDEVDDGVKLV